MLTVHGVLWLTLLPVVARLPGAGLLDDFADFPFCRAFSGFFGGLFELALQVIHQFADQYESADEKQNSEVGPDIGFGKAWDEGRHDVCRERGRIR